MIYFSFKFHHKKKNMYPWIATNLGQIIISKNKRKNLNTISPGKILNSGSTSRSANSIYEQGTASVIPSENWKDTESAMVELCSRRPSELTDNGATNSLVIYLFEGVRLEKEMAFGISNIEVISNFE